MRKPFKERQQFWWLFFFFLVGFPSTHYQFRQSWFKMQEQLGCFLCIPVCRDHIPRGYADGQEAWPPTSDENAGRAQLATTVRGGQARGPPHGPFFKNSFYGAARSLTNDNLG
jgi:hypothetical protein